MHSTTIFLSLLAATGAFAAPANVRRQSDNTVRVALSDLGETGAQVSLQEGVRSFATPALSGPFRTLEVSVGKDVAQQGLRCQALDINGNPLVATRGANVDITFADGDGGAWTFRDGAVQVSQVICDPEFKKVDATSDELSLRVVLQSQSTETGSQTVLPSGARAQAGPVGSSGPYETVELRTGLLVANQGYRCQILDNANQPLIVLRGGNRDNTFSDADKGEWKLETPSEVSKIVCDPTFVAKKL